MADPITELELYQRILNALPDTVIVIDRDYQLCYRNKKAIDAIALCYPQFNTCYGALTGAQVRCPFCPCAKTFADRAPHSYTYFNTITKRWWCLNSYPMLNPENQTVELVVEVCKDITDQITMNKP